MLNPWKKLSKINPQREKGNRQISSDVLEALIRSNLSGGEFKICFAIIHRTWGFNKLSDVISVKQFIQMTELSVRAIKLIIKQLKIKRIIYYQPSKTRVQRGSPLNEFLFNKHYDTWLMQGCKTVHPCLRVQDSSPINGKDNDFIDNNIRVQDSSSLSKGAKSCQKRVQNSSPTIESITKEKILNTSASPLADDKKIDEKMVSEPTTTQEVKTATAQNAVDPLEGIEAKGRQAEVKIFIDFAFKTYQDKFNAPLDVTQGKDGNIVKGLLSTFGLDCLKNLWLKFLVFDDWLINQSGRSIGVFKKSVNKLNSAGKPRKKDTRKSQSFNSKPCNAVGPYELYRRQEAKKYFDALSEDDKVKRLKAAKKKCQSYVQGWTQKAINEHAEELVFKEIIDNELQFPSLEEWVKNEHTIAR